MGSKGRAPPPHLRRPLPGPGIMHPDPFGLGIHPPPGAFPPFDMLPPPEIMEQKLAAQHVEMQTLAAENQRLAATHTTLRQELAAAQQELQRLQAQIGGMKTEKEQQMRGLMDKIAKMEVNLQTTEPVKLELQQARADAQSLIGLRQELISKVQQLSQDLQRSHGDVQQIPALMSELEGLKQEYQHCRATYDYEKKLYHDHLESLQVMEKNYVSMAREVEKLRAELSNTNNLERRTGVPYGTSTGYKENEAAEHHPVGQNAYEGGYGVPQGHGPPPGAAAAAAAAASYGGGPPGPTARAGYDAPRGAGYDSQRGPSYDAQRGPGYDAPRGPGYDSQRGPGYDAPRGPGYDAQRGPSYDAPRGPGYDAQRGPGYDAHRGPSYDAPRDPGYDAPTRGAGVPQGQGTQGSSVPYGSATPPARGGGSGGYEASQRGGNPVRR
ncbi:protein FLX-like 2 isoform X1 [Macadamia integrifolia]|uniref:protein FLX-like 2 isoform X1 n=1 Tax=Macadamia integrifolia TaxID=60698 RepID=UPI001C4EE2AB|nr:protein FLX-like 2 isoform X1 [Macadamia integrifolia]XP_042485303.1 protein FLX-like 2 isoform X1 [Macadamia integrifolia]